MKFKCIFVLVAFAAATGFALQQSYTLTPSNDFVIITFSNKYPFGVSTLEGRSDRRWIPVQNFFATQSMGSVVLPLPVFYTTNTAFDPETSITTTNITTNSVYSELRLRHVSIAPGNAFKNLALVYGDLSTVAGLGDIVPPGTNAWRPEHEGAPATTVPLSNPRAVVADNYGHIYVLEKDSHALSVIDGANGTFHTAIGPLDFPGVGIRKPGKFALDPGFQYSGRQVFMQNPSGLFYRNEKIYVLDAGNGRVLRYTNGLASPTNGLVSNLFTERDEFGTALTITNGGGLWVSADELEAYYTDGTMLKHWEAATGIEIITAIPPFVDLATVIRHPVNNRLIVVDRGANRVGRANNGELEVIAGNGRPFGRSVGKAVDVSLYGPSSIVYLPVGGYLLGLDQGAGVWQVDSGNNAAELVFGEPGVHAGDGEWFQKGRRDPKVSNVLSVTLAPSDGDILMVEGGYVRRINFLRHKP